MNKVVLLNVLFSFLLCAPSADAQSFKWVKGGGTGEGIYMATTPGAWKVEGTYQMCVDHNNNVYALSEVGALPLVADTFHSPYIGCSANLLLTSYTCDGQMRFAKIITSWATTGSYSLLADSLGHIYVAGLFSSNGNPLKIGSLGISGHENQLNGLIQFDTLGNYNWINFIGDNTSATYLHSWSYSNFILLDKVNNVHYINYTKAGVHLTPTLTSQFATYDLMYSPTGALLNIKKLAIDSSWYLDGAIIGNNGKLYAFGEKSVNYGTDQFFAAAFDTNRNLVWKYDMDTAGGTAVSGFTGIAGDSAGHLYFSGAAQNPTLAGATKFTFRSITATCNTFPPYWDNISVILKTDTNANPIWVKHYDGNSSDAFVSITLNGYKVAAAGYFFQQVANGTDTISAGIGIDPFLAVVDTAGNPLVLKSMHGDGYYDQANVIVGDSKGNLYIGGQVEDSIKAGGIGAYTSVGGNSDFFIMKFGYDCNCVAPVANYTHTGTGTVNFVYTGTTLSLDSLIWDFGDGTHAKGATVAHTYTTKGSYSACVTAYSACGRNTYCSSISITTSVSNIAAFPNLIVYPNPMTNTLLIEHAPIGTLARLFNVLGQQVYSSLVTNDRQEINTSNLSSGTYLLQLTGTDGQRAGMTVEKQ
jgi:PKD repeat protein